uniref:Myelin associated glycoprotein n=1 Tax=Anas platyrhynchos TaxID=8839 RepID=A0A8B9ZGK1_ANAPL
MAPTGVTSLPVALLLLLLPPGTRGGSWAAWMPPAVAGLEGTCVVLPCRFEYPEELRPAAVHGLCPELAGKYYFRGDLGGYNQYSFSEHTTLEVLARPVLEVPPEVVAGAEVELRCRVPDNCPELPPLLGWEGAEGLEGAAGSEVREDAGGARNLLGLLRFRPRREDGGRRLGCSVAFANTSLAFEDSVALDVQCEWGWGGWGGIGGGLGGGGGHPWVLGGWGLGFGVVERRGLGGVGSRGVLVGRGHYWRGVMGRGGTGGVGGVLGWSWGPLGAGSLGSRWSFGCQVPGVPGTLLGPLRHCGVIGVPGSLGAVGSLGHDGVIGVPCVPGVPVCCGVPFPPNPPSPPTPVEPQVVGLWGPSEVVEGAQVELGCEAEGRPLPLLSWFRGAAVLREEPATPALRLLLPRVAPAHAGAYSCVAENRHGRHNRTLLLRVACERGGQGGGFGGVWGGYRGC